MFVKRSVFESVGMFPSNVKSGGDVLFTKKATVFGCKLVYAPKANVYHPTRRFWPLIMKMFRVGIGKAQITKISKTLLDKEEIKTIQSGGIWKRLNPLELRKKIDRSPYKVGTRKYLYIFLVSYTVLAIGLAGFLYGKVTRN